MVVGKLNYDHVGLSLPVRCLSLLELLESLCRLLTIGGFSVDVSQNLSRQVSCCLVGCVFSSCILYSRHHTCFEPVNQVSRSNLSISASCCRWCLTVARQGDASAVGVKRKRNPPAPKITAKAANDERLNKMRYVCWLAPALEFRYSQL